MNRQLDWTSDKPQQSVERSPQKGPSSTFQSSKLGSKGKNKRPFNLNLESDEDDEEETSAISGNITTNGITMDDDQLLNGDDEPVGSSMLEQGQPQEEIMNEEPVQGLEADESQIVQPEAQAKTKNTKRRRSGRPPKAGTVATNEIEMGSADAADVLPRRPGRPSKKSKLLNHQDEDAGQGPASPERAKSRPTPPISEREPNIKMKPTKEVNNKRPPSRTGSVGPRSRHVYIPRSETPANDSGALTTRSGRTSIKPLASWRGEKIIFGSRPDYSSLPGIAEVLRTDEIIEPRRKQSTYRRKTRPRAQAQLEDLQEADEELEPWETETGIVQARVMGWDPATGNAGIYDEENTVEAGTSPNPAILRSDQLNILLEVAYAAEAITPRAIKGGNFKFAKTLSLPFFGSGMIEIPPGGSKRVKNSRKMHLVFFVFYGRVTVDMGTPMVQFSIGKGGQWQVPRGKFSFHSFHFLTSPTVCQCRCCSTAHFSSPVNG